MQVESLNISQDQAAEKLQEYTASMRKHFTEMDRAVYQSYQALASGLPVIDVDKAMVAGGVFEDTWTPKVALARIDLERVYFEFTWHEGTARSGSLRSWRAVEQQDLVWQLVIAASGDDESLWTTSRRLGYGLDMPPVLFAEMPDTISKRRNLMQAEYQTIVPPVPVQFRPTRDIDDYMILWEVESWTPSRAPGDPLLLKRIAHPIYVVVAQWDLSELEQRILESFRTRG